VLKSNRLFSVFMVCVIVVLMFCGVQIVEGSDTGSLTVTAFTNPQGGTYDPLEGLNVFLSDEPGDVVFEKTTDENGECVFEPLPQGDYFVRIWGTDTGGTSWAIETFDEVSIPNDESIYEVTLPAEMTPAGSISGKIHDILTQPLADVRVMAVQLIGGSPGPVVNEDMSEADGSYHLEFLYPGEYYILADDGESAIFYNVEKDPEGPPSIVTVESFIESKNKDICFSFSEEDLYIQGTVTESGGSTTPVDGVTVRAKLIGTSDWEEVLTDETGYYCIMLSSEGDYDLVFSKTGYEQYEWPEPVTVKKGACPTLTLGLNQLPPGVVAGTVEDMAGAPLENVEIKVWKPGFPETHETQTDAMGQYSLLNIPPGTYNIEFKLENYITISRDDLVILSGQTTDLDVEMVFAEFTITLSVHDPEMGEVSGGGSFTYNESVTIEATPFSGYKFEKWVEDGVTVSTDRSYTFNIEANRNIVAHFEPRDYTIELQKAPNYTAGTVTINDNGAQGSFSYGEEVTVKAEPSSGYVFAGWTENAVLVSLDEEYTFTVDGDRNLIAQFWPVTPDTTVMDIALNADEKLYLNLLDGQVKLEFSSTSDKAGKLSITHYDSYESVLGQVGLPKGAIPLDLFWKINTTGITGASIRLEVYYDPDELPDDVTEENLKLYRYSTVDKEWTLLPDQGVNKAQNYVWANLTGFSTFGLLGFTEEDANDTESEDETEQDKNALPLTWGDLFISTVKQNSVVMGIMAAVCVPLLLIGVFYFIVRRKYSY